MMALFNLGKKKKEQKKAPACACQCACSTSEVDVTELKNNCIDDAKRGFAVSKYWGQDVRLAMPC